MGNIIAVIGSGRPDSVSRHLVNRAAEVAKQQGHLVKTMDLSTMQLQCCTGCCHCRTQDGCSIQDGFLDDIIAADGIIVGFPIYFSGIAGQSKVWLDRLYPMMDGKFIPRHPGKKVVSIFAQGDSNEKAFLTAINATNYVFRMCGWKLVDSILCAGTSNPNHSIPEQIIDRVTAAANQL